jgi:hypothetical protein
VSSHSAPDVVCCQSAGRGPQLFLRGGGRSWIKRSIKAASKKERQRKKRNIDSTNLRASVKLDPKAVPPGLLLQNELETQALAWLMGGCRPEALPTVNPLDAIEEAKLRLQSMPDVPPRVPRTLKSRQDDEDAEMNDGGEDGGEQQSEDVGSKGSRAIRPARSERGKVAAALQKKASRQGAGGRQGIDTDRALDEASMSDVKSLIISGIPSQHNRVQRRNHAGWRQRGRQCNQFQ